MTRDALAMSLQLTILLLLFPASVAYSRPPLLRRIEPVRWFADALWAFQRKSAGLHELILGRDIELRPSVGKGTGAFALHALGPDTPVGRYDGIMRTADDTYEALLADRTSNDYAYKWVEAMTHDGDEKGWTGWVGLGWSQMRWDGMDCPETGWVGL